MKFDEEWIVPIVKCMTLEEWLWQMSTGTKLEVVNNGGLLILHDKRRNETFLIAERVEIGCHYDGCEQSRKS